MHLAKGYLLLKSVSKVHVKVHLPKGQVGMVTLKKKLSCWILAMVP